MPDFQSKVESTSLYQNSSNDHLVVKVAMNPVIIKFRRPKLSRKECLLIGNFNCVKHTIPFKLHISVSNEVHKSWQMIIAAF